MNPTLTLSTLALVVLFSGGQAIAGGRSPASPHSIQAPQPAPAGMPSFYQPQRSIDTQEWWKPHPYFQSNGQGFGYPTRPVRPNRGYWVESERR